MQGIIWTQATADFFNVIASYVIYYFVRKKLFATMKEDHAAIGN